MNSSFREEAMPQRKTFQIKPLRGILPICAACRKSRNEAGSWEQMEIYIQQYSEVKFTHGLCPECLKHLYPTLP